MANQFLGLSLFIMLLSFFLILNGLSTFDQTKSQPVLNSISVAFSNQDPEDMEANIEESADESFREGSTLDKLEALFKAQITGVDIQKNRLGTVMHIRVDLERFEKNLSIPADSSSRANALARGEFGPMLVSLLQAEDAIPYRIDMILNIPENPASAQNENPQMVSDSAIKVSGFAERFEEAGLPKNLVAAGVGQGPENTIDLYFRRYLPFDPRGKRAGE